MLSAVAVSNFYTVWTAQWEVGSYIVTIGKGQLNSKFWRFLPGSFAFCMVDNGRVRCLLHHRIAPAQFAAAKATASAPAGKRIGQLGSVTDRHTASATSLAFVRASSTACMLANTCCASA